MKGIFKIVIYLSIVFSLVLIFTPSGYAVNTAPKKSGNAKKIEKSAGKNSRPVENPAEAFKITEIKIAGLKNISQSIVFLSITAKPGNTLTRELIDENLKRIYNIGYFNDKISADTVKTSGGACLVFNVTENPIVKNIVIKGNALFNEKTILDVMQTRRGNVFNHSLIASDAGSIQKLFDKNGYVMNRLKDINFDGETLYLIIEENRIERIKIAGNNKTRDRVIMRELKFRTGDIFDDKKVTKSLQKIFNLGYFSEVIPRCEAGSEPGKIDFIIEVKESKTGNYTTAGGYSSANGLVGSFEIEEKNLRGRGQTLNAMVEFGGRRSYSFGFTEPNVNGKNYSLGATVYNVKQDQKLYRTNLDPITYGESRNGFSVTSGRRFTDIISGALTLRDENVKITGSDGIKTAVEDSYIREGHYQTLSSSVSRDTRNSYLEPSCGSFSTLNVDSTGGFLKGPDSFVKYGLTLRKYHALNGRDVIAGRISANAVNLSEGSLPLFERYGLGGADNLRGYDYREFTGERMLLGNIELRHKFTKNFNVHVFYDAGDAWGANGSEAASGNDGGFSLKKGCGAGIVISTPIAPIRLDYARGRSNEGKYYFGMGQCF